MLREGFHPVVRAWWAERFARPDGTTAPPTAAQLGGWSAIRGGADTLIAAPTGSGKTLAAFLHALDTLLRDGLDRRLADEVRVVYVSPLKALSADIHHNLAEPRRAMRRIAEAMGLPAVRIGAAVRTGDTPQRERAAMLRRPPHILVTTPESLYLLLTAERTRAMLRTVRTVIVDEVHAVIESRRGAHLALSLERLDHVVRHPVQRIGLSATQRPIETVARFLAGARDAAKLSVIDEGHVRVRDLGLELPGSPLEAVMSMETWQEVYARIVELVEAHRTTLVFVDTRRLAERLAHHLSERLGRDAVAAHHGSLARETRHDAEQRLKEGRLRALVATSSLELGIDIGHVDLVLQIGAPRRIATFLQRVGRSGHTVGGLPKGRIFPLTRDELVQATALLGAVADGELDRLRVPPEPVDVLAQQIVAEAACEDWRLDDLYDLVRRAYPYRTLVRATFDRVVAMLASGFATRHGRRGALVHVDLVNGRIRGRRGSRLAAITSGGAIPEVADYRVLLEPEGTFVGTVDEDFAVESMNGDVFQLGNTSWRITRIERGTIRVVDARGAPPSIPFWFGEAPSRSDELSAAVARLRQGIEARLLGAAGTGPAGDGGRRAGAVAAADWLVATYGIDRRAAVELVAYLDDTLRLLGTLPTHETLVLERFFDDAGGMQLVLHAPFGSRVNRAWGLALRKTFCRTFNFELQAAATEDAVLLSLGPQHAFPLEEVYGFLHPDRVRDILIQAVLDAPLFATRWRWAATLSLAVLRSRNGTRVPPQIQRMQAEDALAAVFPEAAACLENIDGDREVPDHPLVEQALRDCLDEAMDLPALVSILDGVRAGRFRLVARDTPEPSPLAHEILNARPYAFLDDAPLEERRTQAVYTRRALEPSSAAELGALDAGAIERVRAEAWPDAASADELHDALLVCGFLTLPELERSGWRGLLDRLTADGRAALVQADGWAAPVVVAVERLPELRALTAATAVTVTPDVRVPAAHERDWSRVAAVNVLLRSRLETLGPVTAAALGRPVGVSADEADIALAAIEADGAVLRGSFTPGATDREWCDRRLLARIHRYTLDRLRAEVEPVTAADFMRFLLEWQHVAPASRVRGTDGLAAAIARLEGFEAPAAAWEADLLPARCADYAPELLDALCLTGRVAWGRLSAANGGGAALLRTSPVALFERAHADVWLAGRHAAAEPGGAAAEVLAALARDGACFFHELVRATRLLPTQVEAGLAELVALGRVASDGFSGLRALLTPSDRRPRPPGRPTRRARHTSPYGVESAGRWSLLARDAGAAGARDDALHRRAMTLLARWGVVFRRLLDRETDPPPWRTLVLHYRRMEARGELRGGRFVAGVTGEQFALPEAVAAMRRVRKAGRDGTWMALSAADPLNLTGILPAGERVAALATNRIVLRDGVAVAAQEAGRFRTLVPLDDDAGRAAAAAVALPGVAPQLRAYLRRRARRAPRRGATPAALVEEA
jgi:ATP-dependent Lhr-like helicase